jgi:glutaminyl-tRNA synthetase
VKEGYVDGWDDPRMLTISGLRRRGYTPAAIRSFCNEIGLGKRESWIDMTVLENAVRDDLNVTAPRVMCVLDPVKVVIDNYPEDQAEELEAANHPQDPAMGSRKLPFSRELYIERADFMDNPPAKFHRLGPGREVRLRYGYLITCTSVVKDEGGAIREIHCTYDPATRGGSAPDGRKVKGTIHWVSAGHALPCQVRLYDRLFVVENPEADKDINFKQHLNPHSRIAIETAMAEPSLAGLAAGTQVQFERQGYFCADTVDSAPGRPVFNRIVTLRDTWARTQQKLD